MEKKPVVVLDAGHGGVDSGALGPRGTKESDVALAVVMLLGGLLMTDDVEVVFTRKQDVFVELTERAAIANRAEADLFLSVHCNSAETPARGIETFIANSAEAEFGTRIQSALMEFNKDRVNRGLKRAGFAVLVYTRCKAALAELEFIHTADGENFLSQSKTHLNMAKALRAGILVQLGKASSPPAVATPEQLRADPPISRKDELVATAKKLLQLAENL